MIADTSEVFFKIKLIRFLDTLILLTKVRQDRMLGSHIRRPNTYGTE